MEPQHKTMLCCGDEGWLAGRIALRAAASHHTVMSVLAGIVSWETFGTDVSFLLNAP